MPKRTEFSNTVQIKEKPITEHRFFSQLCALPFVETIYLYGSRARKDADEISDYDLAIVCPKASAEDWQDIVYLLEEAAFLNHIESVRYDTLKDGVFKQQIDQYKQVLYAKN